MMILLQSLTLNFCWIIIGITAYWWKCSGFIIKIVFVRFIFNFWFNSKHFWVYMAKSWLSISISIPCNWCNLCSIMMIKSHLHGTRHIHWKENRKENSVTQIFIMNGNALVTLNNVFVLHHIYWQILSLEFDSCNYITGCSNNFEIETVNVLDDLSPACNDSVTFIMMIVFNSIVAIFLLLLLGPLYLKLHIKKYHVDVNLFTREIQSRKGMKHVRWVNECTINQNTSNGCFWKCWTDYISFSWPWNLCSLDVINIPPFFFF